jgi:hypothetical protein
MPVVLEVFMLATSQKVHNRRREVILVDRDDVGCNIMTTVAFGLVI